MPYDVSWDVILLHIGFGFEDKCVFWIYYKDAGQIILM